MPKNFNGSADVDADADADGNNESDDDNIDPLMMLEVLRFISKALFACR